MIYDALEAAGIELDVSDVVELLQKPEELAPSAEDLSLVEEEKAARYGGNFRDDERE